MAGFWQWLARWWRASRPARGQRLVQPTPPDAAVPEIPWPLQWQLSATRALEDVVWRLGEVRGLPEPAFAKVCAELAHRVRRVDVRGWIALAKGRVSVDRSAVRRFDRLADEDRIAMWALATLASNGHVRELAVARVAASAAPRWLVPIVLRLGDWVSQVRAAALAATAHLLPRVAPDELLAMHADLAPWLAARQGDEVLAFVARLHAEWTRDVRRQWLGAVLAAPAAAAAHRRFALHLVDAELSAAQYHALLRDPDAALRAAVAALLAKRDDGVLDAEVDTVLRDPSRLVQVHFVRALSTATAARFAARILPLCFVRQARLRWVATHALVRAGADPVATCRRLLGDAATRPVAGALRLLGEYGSASDAPLLLPWLRDEDANLRAAALEALGALQGAAWRDEALRALASPSPAVVRAAGVVLRRLDRWTWVDAVRTMALAGGAPSAAAFRLLRTDSSRLGWAVVPDLLFALLHDPASNQGDWARLSAWCERFAPKGWLVPDAATKPWLARAWREWNERPPPEPSFGHAAFDELHAWIARVLAV